MKKTDKTPTSTSSRKMRPALTPEAREDQLISLAINLVEQRLLNGTASSQETTHYLKLAATKDKTRLEIERLTLENELTKAKTESIRAQKRSDELFAEAIKAFKTYSGNRSADDEEEEYDDYQ